ncbi:22830_t:CDS:2 [Racocetra persica]|uniref:22830_t:CDS:1 n=1 Tax=Racocetra persica TaxID=160502 RepID=A0ACA9M0B7_9GLOM|nr:22830_t:CDS:2 [Racocetra persica]
MSKTSQPELRKYMEKRVFIQLNGSRKVTGTLRGFDPFMNLVLDETVEEVSATEKHNIGMVVIRGNSVVIMEALENVG